MINGKTGIHSFLKQPIKKKNLPVLNGANRESRLFFQAGVLQTLFFIHADNQGKRKKFEMHLSSGQVSLLFSLSKF